jgi:hypothetical protein
MVEISQGWTGDLDFQLLMDGVAVNLTGKTVTAQATNKNGASVNLTGVVTVTSLLEGKVRYTPSANDFVAAQSPYGFRFKATTGDQTVMFPNGVADAWIVRL